MSKKYKVNDLIKVVFSMKVQDDEGKPAIVGEVDDYTVVVYHDHITSGNLTKTIIDIMGESTDVRVLEVIEDEKFIVGDIKENIEREREGIIEKLKNGEIVKAKIVKHLSYGAYIDCDGIGGYLKNVNFSDHYVEISDVYKVGDEIEVKLLRMSDTGKLSFEAAEKYVAEKADITEFKVGDMRIVRVISTKAFGTFVRLGVNLDAICPPLKSIVVEEGDSVLIQITEVIEEERRVRALIKKVVRN